MRMSASLQVRVQVKREDKGMKKNALWVSGVIMSMATMLAGCSSTDDASTADSSASPEPTSTSSAPASSVESLADAVEQVENSGSLQAQVDLTYDNGTGNFSSDADPTAKEAVITFSADKTWSAYFASAPQTVFTGTYKAQSEDSGNSLQVEIVHDGTSADGNDNLLKLRQDGSFTETSIGGPGEASGPYTIMSGSSPTSS